MENKTQYQCELLKNRLVKRYKHLKKWAKRSNINCYRLYDKDSGKALGDVLCVAGEKIDENEPYEIFDPNAVWKRTTLTNFEVRDLHVPIFREGKCVYESPSIEEIKQYCKDQIDTLWDETLRLENPQTYYVDLSEKLWTLKHEMLAKHRNAKK